MGKLKKRNDLIICLARGVPTCTPWTVTDRGRDETKEYYSLPIFFDFFSPFFPPLLQLQTS
jgi:hypothetical protein